MEILECIVGIITIVSTITIIKEWITKKTKFNKFKNVYFMLSEWLDEIDINLDKELNLDLLNNREKKIREYIYSNKLTNYFPKIKDKHRVEFLKYCGIKNELLLNKELFSKYSHWEFDFLNIEIFCNLIFAEFQKFYREYKNQSPETSFANLEMLMKFLKIYLKIKNT
ncbi:MAG: hypothetical protein PHV06_11155 [bacterium]|nr:hypothetical protein [bacterium]